MPLRTLSCLALIALIAACTPSGVSPEQIERGRQIYATHCAECHGAKGEGQRPDAPLERDETGRYPAPPHDGTGHTWHHDDDLLFRIVRDGGMGDPKDFYEMPVFGDKLTDEEILAVLAYIKTLWSDEQREMQRQMTEQVRSEE
jgi:mono/diheme cytochrome c family protein